MEPWLVVMLLLQAVYAQDSFSNLTAFNSTRANMVQNGVSGKTHSLHKRGILELAGAVKCSTGRFPLLYLGYGCYCGPGGRGWPRDRTDWCCHRHDCCYDIAEKEGCKPITWRYKWTCMHNTVECDASLDRCQKIICQCDREVAECLRHSRFSRSNILWPNVFCGHTYPMCNFKNIY
ncbi:hypothetical protein lerEdw1_012391 [Lerista edwardsae]|nr:hypothetical protein lerEdw1_012391 [Lerista edwardsae]